MAMISVLEGNITLPVVRILSHQKYKRTLSPPSQHIGFTDPVVKATALPTSASLSIAEPTESEGVKQGMSGMAWAGIAAALAGAYFVFGKK